jgi:multidrug efflux pump subunit AcrA (membrane-fusion protein)
MAPDDRTPATADADSSPTTEPPVEVQAAPVEPVPAVVPISSPQPRRRTLAVSPERARAAIVFPLDGGSITAWQSTPGDRIAEGQVLAALHDPRVDAQAAELDALRDGFAGERARRLAEREVAWRAEGLRLESALGQAAVALEAARGRIAERETLHARNLELVEAGVLGYGEIRADWDALLAARAEAARLEGTHAEAEARVAAHGVAVPVIEAPGAAEALLLARLGAALEQVRAAQVLRAPRAGVLRGPLAEAGSTPLAGQPIAFVEDANATHGVLRLPGEDSGWLSARVLLIAADGVYVPVPVESVGRAADGGWELRFRWPAGIAASEAVLELDA